MNLDRRSSISQSQDPRPPESGRMHQGYDRYVPPRPFSSYRDDHVSPDGGYRASHWRPYDSPPPSYDGRAGSGYASWDRDPPYSYHWAPSYDPPPPDRRRRDSASDTMAERMFEPSDSWKQSHGDGRGTFSRHEIPDNSWRSPRPSAARDYPPLRYGDSYRPVPYPYDDDRPPYPRSADCYRPPLDPYEHPEDLYYPPTREPPSPPLSPGGYRRNWGNHDRDRGRGGRSRRASAAGYLPDQRLDEPSSSVELAYGEGPRTPLHRRFGSGGGASFDDSPWSRKRKRSTSRSSTMASPPAVRQRALSDVQGTSYRGSERAEPPKVPSASSSSKPITLPHPPPLPIPPRPKFEPAPPPARKEVNNRDPPPKAETTKKVTSLPSVPMDVDPQPSSGSGTKQAPLGAPEMRSPQELLETKIQQRLHKMEVAAQTARSSAAANFAGRVELQKEVPKAGDAAGRDGEREKAQASKPQGVNADTRIGKPAEVVRTAERPVSLDTPHQEDRTNAQEQHVVTPKAGETSDESGLRPRLSTSTLTTTFAPETGKGSGEDGSGKTDAKDESSGVSPGSGGTAILRPATNLPVPGSRPTTISSGSGAMDRPQSTAVPVGSNATATIASSDGERASKRLATANGSAEVGQENEKQHAIIRSTDEATWYAMADAKSLADALCKVVQLRRTYDRQTRAARVEPILFTNLSLVRVRPPPNTVSSCVELVKEIADPEGEPTKKRIKKFDEVEDGLTKRFKDRHELLVEKTERLRGEYLMLYETWKESCARLDRQAKALAAEEPANAGRTTRRSAATYGDAVRTDLELERLVAELDSQKLTDPDYLCLRNTAKIPDMISVTRGKVDYVYDDTNNIVDNPSEFYAPRSGFEDWTEEEKQTLLEKFAEFPKQFGIIADYLPHKTPAQCVAYYYLQKKTTIDFRKVISLYGPNKRRRGGRKGTKGKGNALLTDIRQHDAQVLGDPDSVGPVTRRRTGALPSNGVNRRRHGYLDNTPTPTSTPEPDGRQQRSRRVKTVTREEADEDGTDVEPKRAKRGRKPKVKDVTPAASSEEPPAPVASSSKQAEYNGILPPRRKGGVFPTIWTKEDKEQFMELLGQYGAEFKRIAAAMPNKTTVQVTNYYKEKFKELDLGKVAARAPKRSPTPEPAGKWTDANRSYPGSGVISSGQGARGKGGTRTASTSDSRMNRANGAEDGPSTQILDLKNGLAPDRRSSSYPSSSSTPGQLSVPGIPDTGNHFAGTVELGQRFPQHATFQSLLAAASRQLALTPHNPEGPSRPTPTPVPLNPNPPPPYSYGQYPLSQFVPLPRLPDQAGTPIFTNAFTGAPLQHFRPPSVVNGANGQQPFPRILTPFAMSPPFTPDPRFIPHRWPAGQGPPR